MLLVNDGEGQVFKLHLVLNHGVGANDQTRFTTGDHGEGFTPLFGFLAAGQPRGFNTQRLQPGDEFAKVLLSQNLCRCHQRALPTRVHAPAGRQRCNHCFARTYIALQQAVHGNIFLQVSINLQAYALLRIRQSKRQAFKQLLMQCALRAVHGLLRKRRCAHRRTHAPRLQLRQLLGQQFLGFQALPGRVTVVF